MPSCYQSCDWLTWNNSWITGGCQLILTPSELIGTSGRGQQDIGDPLNAIQLFLVIFRLIIVISCFKWLQIIKITTTFPQFQMPYASKVILYYERHMMVQSIWNTLQIKWNVYKITQVDNVWCIQNTWSPRVSRRKPSIQEQAQPALEGFCDSLPIFKEWLKPHWPSFWRCATSVLASTIVTSKFHALKELRNAEGESCIH